MENVNANMELALDNYPETFGKVRFNDIELFV